MKKGPKSKGKGGGKGKGTPNQPITPTKPSKLWRWLRLAKVIGLILAPIATLATVLGHIIGIGPLWPTSPSFTPGPPSYGAAMDIPFTIENNSALFGISNLTITCVISASFVGSPEGSPPQINIGVRASGMPAALSSTVGAAMSGRMKSGSYICPLRDNRIGFGGANAADRIKSAQVSFRAEYDARIPWGSRVASDEGPFTLVTTVPQYWVKGALLK
ncbi:hypothetical protein [Bradyrhizobium sp. LVM 105]|uniref:hypothetical protein n=1 Tax=Bradyrhizobium sp. LVM 105 TaxID=2341115 RepID=UPI00196B93BF|nr:hypothetical protein [Bradyrhizobium sp. LVM 105]